MLQDKNGLSPRGTTVVVATPHSGTELTASVDRYLERLGAAYAERTRQIMSSDWRCFSRWCGENGQAPFPASAETIMRYLADLAPLYRLSTLRRRLASLSHIHQALGVANPIQDHQVRITLRGLARLKGQRPEGRRAPLLDADVKRMLAATGRSLRDCRDRALLLTARDTLARRSELARLEVADLDFRATSGDARVLLRRTKADPDGRSAWLSPETCRALRWWLRRARIKKGAIFCQVDNGGRVGDSFHPQSVAKRFKAMARAAGLDERRISGHSTRIGMAVDLVADGHSLVAVQLAGGWANPAMPAHYAADLLPELGAVARYHAARKPSGGKRSAPGGRRS
ncbi:tyrosine-type recombinase/integrase [Pelagibius sp. 7325]|uniref:tyrosine-type recombinase/integrase n=1 Tax=Pelagibius sp. 7325 TaxID=3131994 RepID=UPI0030EC28BE